MNRRYFPTVVTDRNDYPTSDGRPTAETDAHRKLMLLVIETLLAWYETRPDVYVTGNLLLFYEQGNKRRHVAPDCFVALGVPNHDRLNYLLWNEKRGPAVVIEITSKTTRKEDTQTKFALYRDVLAVPEYFLFDPKTEYLDPPMQGYRLTDGRYERIDPVGGRLVSDALGLHLERSGETLRFWNPQTQAWLPIPAERLAAERAAKEAERAAKEAERAAREAAEAEVEWLRREIEQLRHSRGTDGSGAP